MTTDLEQRLRAAAQQWQQTQPPPPAVTASLVADRRRRPGLGRPRLVVPAVAAAVALIVVAAAVVLGGSEERRSTTDDPAGRTTDGPTLVPWEPLPPSRPRATTRFDEVVVSGTIEGSAEPGETVDFEIYLSSDEDVSLAPCPNYEIWFGTTAPQRWRLNCAAVPHVDAAGRRYLPAGTDVGFQMRLTVPDGVRGEQKVVWVLLGPRGQLPGTHGLVTVR